jgi:Ca2+-binding EF-hand superfamily protein
MSPTMKKKDSERLLEKKELSSSGREFAKQLLKSTKLKLDFKPVFAFFGVPETGNLLADITLLHQVFVKETTEDEETVEMSKAQAKRVSRLEKMLLQRLLRYIFEFYDKDGSGQIEKNELFQFTKDVISVMPPQYYSDEITENDNNAIDTITSNVLEEFMDECDDDEDGMISYEELAHHLPNIFRRMVATST